MPPTSELRGSKGSKGASYPGAPPAFLLCSMELYADRSDEPPSRTWEMVTGMRARGRKGKGLS